MNNSKHISKDFDWKPVIDACIKNDRKAQEKLYRHFFPIMERMVLRYTQDSDQIIDILNDGFLRVFQKVHLFKHQGSFEGWVRRIIYHSIFDYIRSNTKYREKVVFEEKEQALIFANKANEVAKTIDSEEIKTEISELLSQLTQE